MHLIIAEKNQVAERIAAFLSGPNARVQTKKDGNCTQYYVGDNVVMGLRGHIVELDFVDGYTSWRSEEHPPRSLLDAGIKKLPTEQKIVSAMKALARKSDKITIATDFDREGELIGKEAVELIRQANKNVPIVRARFSAITKDEILTSLKEAQALDENLAASGEARQIIDLVWGASLTRFMTIAGHRSSNGVLSVGRVQSPTLAMIVDREKEIEAFVPQKYWELSLTAKKGADTLEARHVHGKFDNKEEAKKSYDATKEPVKITDVITGKKTDKAPTPLDTTALIVGAGRLGISAASAMNRAEELYMNGFISYPRTDNTTYPKSLNITEQLRIFSRGCFKGDVEYTMKNLRPVPTRGKKETTDHPPIYPTGQASPEQMDPVTWKLYEFVVRRFLATVCIDAEWETMKINLSAGTEPYTSTGARLVVPGWRGIYPYSKAEDNILPACKVGDIFSIANKDLAEKETLPPPRYSQSKLIQEMEKLGLGTKSTRADTIQKLLNRKYIEGNPLKPTVVGRAITETLEDYAETITAPEMTQTLETHMQDIAAGTKKLDSVLDESKGMLSRIFDELEKNEESIGNEIMDKTRETALLGPCPVCGKQLAIKYVGLSKQFIGCNGYPECSFNMSLPPTMWGRAVKLDEVCPTHGVNHIALVKKGSLPWKFGCPVCNHIATGKANLSLIPGSDESLIENLQAHHIYNAYDLVSKTVDDLATLLGITKEEADKLQDGGRFAQDILKKRADMKKFITPFIGFKKGRSKPKIYNALVELGCNSIKDLTNLSLEDMEKTGLTNEEANAIREEASKTSNIERMKEAGVSAVSLKKYVEKGYGNPGIFAMDPAEKVAEATGVSVATVTKHQKLVKDFLKKEKEGN